MWKILKDQHRYQQSLILVPSIIQKASLLLFSVNSRDDSCHFLGLFSAILQSSARSIALPIDQLKFNYRVLDNEEESHLIQSTVAHDIANGITIDGIYLDGAQWDNEQHQMVDCTDQQRTHRLPPLLCKLIPVGSIDRWVEHLEFCF